MNRQGRDVLLTAFLQGIKQLRWCAADGRGGFCAIGLLLNSVRCVHLTMSSDWFRDPANVAAHHRCLRRVATKYRIGTEEWTRINTANHTQGCDFLTIAWMFTPKEPAAYGWSEEDDQR